MTRAHFLALVAAGLTACRKSSPAPGVDDGTTHRYQLRGVVVRRDESLHSATIKHERITDDGGSIWMEAMTMEFPVPGPADFARLPVGAAIHAVVVSRASDAEYWIEQVQAESR